MCVFFLQHIFYGDRHICPHRATRTVSAFSLNVYHTGTVQYTYFIETLSGVYCIVLAIFYRIYLHRANVPFLPYKCFSKRLYWIMVVAAVAAVAAMAAAMMKFDPQSH